MNYKVLITTSGLGQRLGEATKYTNKSLIRVGKKPALSYIIEAYPKEVEIVITVGYFGNQIKDFVKLAYPDRKVTFVEVDKYQGLGSSLAYSMLQAKNQLQCPFIFHASDTIITEQIPEPVYNWNGGYVGGSTNSYSSFTVINDKVVEIKDKGAEDYDFLHIGLVGIYEYEKFWNKLQQIYDLEPNNSANNDCKAINAMLKDDDVFYSKQFDVWYDTGNIESLNQVRKVISDGLTVLDKVDESIYIFDDFVIKFFYNEKNVEQRVQRAKILGGLVPEIQNVAGNFYRYKYVPGELYSRAVNPNDFKGFLKWAGDNLWQEVSETDDDKFKETCHDFYYTKTIERVGKLMERYSLKDDMNIINGEEVPSLEKIFSLVDFNWLAEAKQTKFHGDFILDNIIKTKEGYCLLDWRQNFGGLISSGDMYYDLAKLNHNLSVNHDIINQDLFTIKVREKYVDCDILRKNNLVFCQEVLMDYISRNAYDERKVKILTAIIWLNMSPLHHHPFDLFLYYFGKYNLWKIIK